MVGIASSRSTARPYIPIQKISILECSNVLLQSLLQLHRKELVHLTMNQYRLLYRTRIYSGILPFVRGQGAYSVAPQSVTASLWHSKQLWPPAIESNNKVKRSESDQRCLELVFPNEQFNQHSSLLSKRTTSQPSITLMLY